MPLALFAVTGCAKADELPCVIRRLFLPLAGGSEMCPTPCLAAAAVTGPVPASVDC